MNPEERKPLAWHETMELHELTALQSIGLMKVKMAVRKVNNPQLRELYVQTILGLEKHVRELIKYYPSAQGYQRSEDERELEGFYAGDLLALSKTLVRNYAIAITETATPVLRQTLTNHLLEAIKIHERVFNYMYQRELYPAYDLGQLIENDLNNAQKALSMGY